MASIEIDIPRPWLTLAVIGAIIWFATGGMRAGAPTAAQVSDQGAEPQVGQPEAGAEQEPDRADTRAAADRRFYTDQRLAAPDGRTGVVRTTGTAAGKTPTERAFFYPTEDRADKVFYRQDDNGAASDGEPTFYRDHRATDAASSAEDASAGQSDAQGGPDEEWLAKQAEDAARDARARQAVVSRKEDILPLPS